jgi:adenylate cyclase class IV
MLTVKRRRDGDLDRDELETTIGDFDTGSAILETLGLKAFVHIQKRRRVMTRDSQLVRVNVDEVRD